MDKPYSARSEIYNATIILLGKPEALGAYQDGSIGTQQQRTLPKGTRSSMPVTAGILHNEGVPPFAWHKQCFKKFKDLEYAAICADVGTGKSAMLLYLCAHKYKQKIANAVLLFAPNSVYRQWLTQQLPIHCPVPYKAYAWGTYSTAKDILEVQAFTDEDFNGLKFLLVNVEAMSSLTYVDLFKQFVLKNSCIVAIDEATRIKTHTAKRTQNILLGLNNARFVGKRLVDLRLTSVARYILTGSAVTNTVLDLYSEYDFLKPNYFNKPYTMFKMRYSIERKCMIPGGRVFFKKLTSKEMSEIRRLVRDGCPADYVAMNFGVSVWDIQYVVAHPEATLAWKNLDELKKLIDPVTYTVTIQDCFDDIPEKQYITLEAEMTAVQKKIYSSLRRNLYVELGGSEMTVTNKLVLVGRLQQVTGGFVALKEKNDFNAELAMQACDEKNPKYEVLRDDMEDNGEYPVLIFCRYIAEAKFIAENIAKDLEKNVGLIIGEVKVPAREVILTDFDNGDVDVIVATPGCLSTGRNLQRSHIIYFFSNDYSIDSRYQTGNSG